ncbi:lipid acyl hydrolase [Niveomyces insectorum RCEF 264]|uniref:Lipid acyl hydrolase n=1 Tax=Niveomyces insectorum RCEF 264 TaxID=1081102 RepID=A0A167Y477_9HYPO|nr:lipid acyl hydrolase [Niveomyces insectorum RCEF 264]
MKDFLLFSAEGNSPPDHLSRRGMTSAADKGRGQPQSPTASPSSLSANIDRQISSVAERFRDVLRVAASSYAERRLQRLRNERQQILEQRMANATTYDEWEAAARLLDELEGHEAWKSSDTSDEFYNPDLIRTRLWDLDDARLSADVRRMMHLVRTALSRDVGGISSAGLYNHTRTGTKHLVERYVQASIDLITTLVDRTRSAKTLPAGLTHREMLDQLLLARRSYGRSALILSGGSVYGMAHIGVLKALFERNLLPRIISGTSAGSIVAAVVCTRTNEEIPLILERFAHNDLAVFTDKDNPDSWLTHIGRALRYGAWHDSRHIARVMRNLLGDITFQEAFNRTRRILNITVSSKPGLQLPSLLNYLTAPDVIIWSAVVASCSIPGVFDPRPLLVRDAATGEHVPWDPAEQLWIDGSLDNDVPVERLGEMLNVNHFIVSQTNPHIVLFVRKDEKLNAPHHMSDGDGDGDGGRGTTISTNAPTPSIRSNLLDMLGWLGKSEAIYCLETLVSLGLFRGGASVLLQMLSQRYTADINILPRMGLAWGTNLIRNPTPEFMLEACRVGEQATWPSISRISQACAVELALDRAVHRLRERIAFSDSQVNLRRFFTGAYELGLHNSFGSPGSVGGGADGDKGGGFDGDARDAAFAAPGAASAFGSLPLSPQLATRAHRHKRRGSGGSIQLSARRRSNRYELDTILSEDGGHDSDPERLGWHVGGGHIPGFSLAAGRGMADFHLSSVLDHGPKLTRSNSYGVPNTSSRTSHGLFPPGGVGGGLALTPQSGSELRPAHSYRSAVKQNSLQQLPMSIPSKAPSPSASFVRKSVDYGFSGGSRSLTPYTTTAVVDDDEDGNNNDNYEGPPDEGESPLLQMRSRQQQRRRRSSASSAVSAVSAAAAAAVAAAHQAVIQAVGGANAQATIPTITTTGASLASQAQRYAQPNVQPSLQPPSQPLPSIDRLTNTDWYTGAVRRRGPPPEADGVGAGAVSSGGRDEGTGVPRATQQQMRPRSSAHTPRRHNSLGRRGSDPAIAAAAAAAGADREPTQTRTAAPANRMQQPRPSKKLGRDNDQDDEDDDEDASMNDTETDADEADPFGSGDLSRVHTSGF